MESLPGSYKAHVFVCTNQKKMGACCAAKDAMRLKDDLKRLSKEKHSKSIRINSSGCLGSCEKGIAIAIYPNNQWLHHVKADQAEEVLSWIDSLVRESND